MLPAYCVPGATVFRPINRESAALALTIYDQLYAEVKLQRCVPPTGDVGHRQHGPLDGVMGALCGARGAGRGTRDAGRVTDRGLQRQTAIASTETLLVLYGIVCPPAPPLPLAPESRVPRPAPAPVCAVSCVASSHYRPDHLKVLPGLRGPECQRA